MKTFRTSVSSCSSSSGGGGARETEEKLVLYNSLDQFKQTLHKRLASPHLPASASPQLEQDMFDELSPSLVNFSLKPTPRYILYILCYLKYLLSTYIYYIYCRVSAASSVQGVCETVSRLLFLSMSWCRQVPGFTSLAPTVQVSALMSANIFQVLRYLVFRLRCCGLRGPGW